MQKIIIKTGRTYPALAEKLGDLNTGLPASYRQSPATGAWWMCSGRSPAAVQDCAAR
jgi:GMP synthase (glutamine-hydrolysing)